MQGIAGTRRQALHRGADLEVVPTVGKAIIAAHGDAVFQCGVKADLSVRAAVGQRHVLAVARKDLAAQRVCQGAVHRYVGCQRHRGCAAHRDDLNGRRAIVETRVVIVKLHRLHPGAAARQGDERHTGINLDESFLEAGIGRLHGFAGSGRGFLFCNADGFRRQLRIRRKGTGWDGIVKFRWGRRRRRKQDRPRNDHDQGQYDSQNGSFFHANVLCHDSHQGWENQRRRATRVDSAARAKRLSTGRATTHTRTVPGRRTRNNWDKNGKMGEREATGLFDTPG